ncbi:MAG: YcxB family protein [Propionicimonas sp.]|uniref:YcxB family protein n=1 Tax=Propionicimonas sp. TaxID=1955623 RepID=UPI003D0ED4FA
MLEYTLTPSDLAAFTAWRAGQPGTDHSRRRRYRMAAAWVAGTAAYLVVFAISTLPLLLNLQLPLAGLTELLDIAVGVAVGWWEWRGGRLADWLLHRRALSRAWVALERTGAARRAWLDEDGLNIASGERVVHVDWASIERVVETDDHVFVLTGPDAAHVIPRRAGVDELVAALRAHLTPGR